EHTAAILQFPQRVGHGSAIILADQHAIATTADTTFAHGAVSIENMAHEAGTARECKELALETDQTTRRNAIFQARTATTVGLHIEQFALAAAQLFHDAALMAVFQIDRQQFERLVAYAVDILVHYAWAGHGQLVTFAAHVFQQNSKVQLTTTADFKYGVVISVVHAQCHVGFQFAIQTI